MVILKEIFHFSRFQGGGGSNFFQGGSNCLLPLETHITCDFPGGGVGGPDPLSPLWIRTCNISVGKYEGQSQAGFSTFLSRPKEGKALGFQNLRMDAVLNS